MIAKANDLRRRKKAYVEKRDTPEDTLDRLRYVASRVLRFSGGEGDDFGSEERVGCLNEHGQEGEELTFCPRNAVVLLEWDGFPVSGCVDLSGRVQMRRGRVQLTENQLGTRSGLIREPLPP